MHRLFIFIFCFVFLSVFAQENRKISYQKIVNGKVTNECFLLFDKQHSIFITLFESVKTQPYRDEDGVMVTPSNTIDSIANKPKFVYYQRKKDDFFVNDINNNEETIIRLDRNSSAWELTEEHKKIGDFTCYKAVKSTKDKKYIAWYTPDISFPYGPIAINGLKGVILELYTEDKSLHFVFQHYEKTDEKVEKYIQSYGFDKAISFSEYQLLRDKRKKEFLMRSTIMKSQKKRP